MTRLQVIVMTCVYAVALVAAIYLTRATSRRVVGALAGGAAAACWGLGVIILGEALRLWRDFLPSTLGVRVLFYLGLTISLSPMGANGLRHSQRSLTGNHETMDS